MYEQEVREMVNYMNEYMVTFKDFLSNDGDADAWYTFKREAYASDLICDEYSLAEGACRACIIDGENALAYKFDITPIDYCERERLHYLEAVDAHLEQYFVPVEKVHLDDYDRDVYVQPLVNVDEDYNMEYISDGIDFDEEEFQDSCDLVMNCLPAKLVDFLNKHEINDLHEGNISIDDDGNIVIFDYAGYELV